MSKNDVGENNGLNTQNGKANISLKELAKSLNLSPTTVSIVLNNSKLSNTIPKETKERIFEVARNLNYRPNFIARSLRNQKTHTIGVLVPEISEGYCSMVLSGIEEKLFKEGYFYFVASHRHREELIEKYSQFFVERCVEGILVVDTPQKHQQFLPVVSISGHDNIKGITNIILNHQNAADLSIQHLANLGHKNIAIIKGQDFSSDTEVRWNAICEAMRKFELPINEKLVTQLVGDNPSPEIGFIAMQKILNSDANFSAVIAFNDISAMGATSALNERGIEVPKDVSVIGFDDIYSAAFHNPPLTTIRQPLKEMGVLGAEYLLKKIKDETSFLPSIVTVEPSLVVRASTAKHSE